MITDAMIADHKRSYPSFDADEFTEWIDAGCVRHWYKSVAKANTRRHKNKGMLCTNPSKEKYEAMIHGCSYASSCPVTGKDKGEGCEGARCTNLDNP